MSKDPQQRLRQHKTNPVVAMLADVKAARAAGGWDKHFTFAIMDQSEIKRVAQAKEACIIKHLRQQGVAMYNNLDGHPPFCRKFHFLRNLGALNLR